MIDQAKRFALSEAQVEQIFAMSLFKGTPPATKKLITKFARLEQVSQGTELLTQGAFTSDFYMVASGLVSAYRRESDGGTRLLVELGPGDWFGELSALSNQPSPASLKADTGATLLVLESGLFKDVYKSSRGFRKSIDERYRERSLEMHLAVVPAFRDLSRDQLARLREVAEFQRVGPGDALAQPGGSIEAVHLVRSGSVTFHRVDPSMPDGERLDGYLMENSSFGEVGLWRSDASWDGTYRARTDVDLLLLPIQAIREEFRGDPAVLDALEAAAKDATRADVLDVHEDETHVMAHRGSVKGGEALVIDLEKCVRCNACVESCVAVHDDGVPRLSKTGFRVAAEANTTGKDIALVTSCYHCQTPGCMMACSYGAIRRDPQGLIRFIGDNCVGCAMCVQGCPYDVIRLTDPPGSQVTDDSFLSKIPVIGPMLAKASKSNRDVVDLPVGDGFHKDVEVQGRAVKCDRCEGLPFEACVYNCPCGAIERRAPSDLFGGASGGARS